MIHSLIITSLHSAHNTLRLLRLFKTLIYCDHSRYTLINLGKFIHLVLHLHHILGAHLSSFLGHHIFGFWLLSLHWSFFKFAFSLRWPAYFSFVFCFDLCHKTFQFLSQVRNLTHVVIAYFYHVGQFVGDNIFFFNKHLNLIIPRHKFLCQVVSIILQNFTPFNLLVVELGSNIKFFLKLGCFFFRFLHFPFHFLSFEDLISKFILKFINSFLAILQISESDDCVGAKVFIWETHLFKMSLVFYFQVGIVFEHVQFVFLRLLLNLRNKFVSGFNFTFKPLTISISFGKLFLES